MTVRHCVVRNNDVGLRFGDSYDWGARGHMAVSHSVVVQNRTNVRNFTNSTGGPFSGGIDVSCSVVDSPELDGTHGNIPGVPALAPDGCLSGQQVSCDGAPLGLGRCP